MGTAHKIVHDDLAFPRSVVIVFQQDNARSYSAEITVETLSQFAWELLPYLSNSPDLVISDIHLFGPLKEFLCGTTFSSDDKSKSNESK